MASIGSVSPVTKDFKTLVDKPISQATTAPQKEELPLQPAEKIQETKQHPGCFIRGIFALVLFMLFVLFSCGLGLVVYIVFPPAPVDILVMGLDSRTGDGFVSRSDSIMLLGINPARLQANLLSFPRDLFIDVPNYGSQRINTINMLGEMDTPGSGPQLLADSIEQTFQIKVDHYLRMDFAMFVELVDAVGGITIYVEHLIIDDAYPTADGGVTTIRFESGNQYMDGERALIYARTRHGSDDFRRAEHQQQILSAIAKKLSNPIYWPGVLWVLNQYLDTDMNLWDMLTIAPPLLLNGGRFDQLVIDRDYILGTAQGHAIPNMEAITPWIQDRFD